MSRRSARQSNRGRWASGGASSGQQLSLLLHQGQSLREGQSLAAALARTGRAVPRPALRRGSRFRPVQPLSFSADSLNCLTQVKQLGRFIQTLAEWFIAAKPPAMRRSLAYLALAALALIPGACRQKPAGAVNVTVIGGEPKIRDPALGPLSTPDSVLVGNVAQGLVSFDAAGNIVGGLAERWNVSDDGMSYIFRLAATKWPDGRPVTAQQAARLLKRAIGPRSKDSLRDVLGAVNDVVAMTDRVIEIELTAPRPNLLAVLAQPELAILRSGEGTGPFIVNAVEPSGELRLQRQVLSSD